MLSSIFSAQSWILPDFGAVLGTSKGIFSSEADSGPTFRDLARRFGSD